MKISIRNFLTFTIITGILLLVSLIIFSSYYSTKKAMTQNAYGIMDNITDFALNKSKQYLKTARNAANLTQRLESKNVVNSQNKELMISYFYEQLQINQQFSSIYYSDLNGNFLMLLRDENRFLVKDLSYVDDKKISSKITYDKSFKNIINKDFSPDSYDPRNRPWFKKVIEKKSIIWTEPYVFFTSQHQGITVASPIYNETSTITGVIGVDIEITELSKFITNLKISENSKVFMMDSNSNVIAFPNISTIKFNENKKTSRLKRVDELEDNILIKSYEELSKNNSSTIDKKVFLTFETDDSVTYNALFSPFNINNINWIIGMYLPQNDYLGTIKDNQQFNIAITILFGILFIIIGFYFAKSITNPLENLLHMSKELKSLNLNIPCIEKTNYSEINELIDTSNKMKESLKDAYTDTLFRLAIASEYKDTDTASHIKRMGLYSVEIGRELDLSDEQLYILEHASAMHDIGKLAIDDAILMKPGRLSPQERVEMEKHSVYGAKILDNPTSEIMEEARIIALYHHEKWNGKGYPEKLKGEAIPLYARIVAIADVFDALVSKRCYKESLSYEKSRDIILEAKGVNITQLEQRITFYSNTGKLKYSLITF